MRMAPTARGQSIFLHTPMGRFGEPRELVGAGIFLSQRKASGFLTGSDLRVDGGFRRNDLIPIRDQDEIN